MGMTGLQIFKLLPNTNCKECNHPTCLAFAMKLAAGKESLDKCPYASEELKAALGAASLPPIRGVTIGWGDRAVTAGEETVFFRHEKTFVRSPGLFRLLEPSGLSESEMQSRLDGWAAISLERAGEVFRVDGIAVPEAEGSGAVVSAVRERKLPLALLAETPEGAARLLKDSAGDRPLLVPPAGADRAPYTKLAAELKIPLVVWGKDLDDLAGAADGAAKAGVADILLSPPADTPRELHRNLSQLRRGALDRIHPGIAYPVYLRIGSSAFEKGVLGIAKFASLLVIDDPGGEAWLPLWTLRQNIYTDPQKPLQIDPGIYPIGDPDENSPLFVTTNFSLTYFIVSTELESAGISCRLAVADAEGMSVLTAWSAGKFSGERVGKILQELGATRLVKHRTVIIPGYVAVIAGELEDTLGDGWRVLVGPQEASDVGAFFREIWESVLSGG